MATTQTLVRTIPDIFYEDPEPVEDHMLQEEPLTPIAHCTAPLIAPAFPRLRYCVGGKRISGAVAARKLPLRPNSFRPLAGCCAAL